ncbi:arylesterase [Formosa algae]|uniref:Acyl-CoA thioesterase-1 n=1 Tax=Formosa algae TaxID=225843 RepID=A0A9X1CD19_9FLAO|nr:arylesterase [Formosa algae]MBP1841697.1 acyl-CoA thioesterase-1 [Formosa algae]MDQ0337102.1 acyl-CoA thioesterase-1 [Formosa algae]OEI80523.1 arylesterase [Formosa algae]
MCEAQNKQLQSLHPWLKVSKLLKFCYFIVALLLISCGNEASKQQTTTDTVNAQAETTETPETKRKTILCFGDSITAGYGLDDTNDAYPGKLQDTINALNLDYTVINSGVSGETSAGGKSRIDWVIKQKPTIFLLELGANDGLRGVPITETRANLQAIIDVVKSKSPDTQIVLAGMQLPPNMGADYTTDFKQLFIDLAAENNIGFIPFILEQVGGIPELNQRDGIHPNVDGHKLVAHTVWDVLGPMVKS